LDDENEFYEVVGGSTAIAAKMEALKKLMAEQVDGGALTQQEIDRLLAQVRDRIDALDADIDAAVQRGHEKKAAQLTAQKGKAEARRRKLESHAARPPLPLKKEAQITQLAKQLQPLLKLEEATKGRLLSVKETRELAAKEDISEEIAALEEASRGWFEDDDAFEARVAASRRRRAAAAARGGGSAAGRKGKKPASGKTWTTPGGLPSKQNMLAKKTAPKKATKRSNGTSAFAAMMADSDSE